MAIHKPVLLKETIEFLNLKKGDVVVDATLGGGGHSETILKKIGDEGKLIAIDLDKNAIERFKLKVQKSIPPGGIKIGERVFLINDNFANLEEILTNLKIKKVNAILADLGWSSDQISDHQYGMSFMLNAPLDMRYDRNQELTAKKVVNEYPQKDLERVIKNYGEERWAKCIVREIVEIRKTIEIATTRELAKIVENAIPKKFWPRGIHPATRTFQALRIEVNEELDNLKKFIPVAVERLAPGGRLGIISFHSLEDRIVKNMFRDNAGGCVCPKDFPQCVCGKMPKVKLINKKPIISGKVEIRENPRARSARFRVVEKTNNN